MKLHKSAIDCSARKVKSYTSLNLLCKICEQFLLKTTRQNAIIRAIIILTNCTSGCKQSNDHNLCVLMYVDINCANWGTYIKARLSKRGIRRNDTYSTVVSDQGLKGVS